ncbi:MAG: extracellular solute-binding protein [Kiritimatiellae bacterium]|nr:extracellular solute-binding protein [Kiritimatiellia bacterium]
MRTGIGLVTLLLIGAPAGEARAGWVEQAGGRTIIHVSLFDLPDPSRTDAATRADAAAVREFIRRFPALFAEKYRERYRADPARYGAFDWDHVEIRLERFSGIQVEGVESDLLAIAGGMAPDVLYVNFRKSDTYIQNGFLYPLDGPGDEYLASMTEDELALRVNPKIWPVIRRRGPGGGKHVWALPYGGALGRVLLYRKDLFDEAGLAYPTKDWTWDDLLHAARRLTRPEEGRYGLAMGRGKHESWYWVTFLWSAGGEVMTYDEGQDEWRIAFDSPAGVEALDFYTRLGAEPWTDEDGRPRRGYAYKDPRFSFRKWERGEIGMVFAYVDEKLFSTINPDLTGMAPVPLGPGGGRGAELNSRMMGLFAGIGHPAVRDAAWEYIRFFDSREALALKTRVLVEGGLGQFVNPRYLELFGYGDLVRLSPPGWAETFRIAIETGRPEPYGRHSNIAYNLMTLPLQEAEQRALRGDLPQDGPARREVLAGLLKDAADQARADMLDVIPPARRRVQRLTAAVVLVSIGVAFGWMFRRVSRAFAPDAGAGAPRAGWAFRRYAGAYLMLLPAVAAIFVWRYVPLARGAAMAFQDYRLLGDSAWVGLDNFGRVLWSVDWWLALWNALRYSALVMGLTFLPPVILAILLQEVPRGRVVFRVMYYLPAVMTGLVVVLLWKSFYEPGERGVLNALWLRIPAWGFLAAGGLLLWAGLSFARRLRFHDRPGIAALFLLAGGAAALLCWRLAWPLLVEAGAPWWKRLLATHQDPQRWLGDPRTAMPACVLPMLWAGMGPGSLIYLAALKSIPDELYEAAELDGATFTDKILFVVFPMLKPLLIINSVGVFIGSWHGAADTILAMTGGAAGTEVAGLHIFYKAFLFLQFGPATAMAWILALLLIGFTVYQLRILSRLEFRTAQGVEG